MSGDDVLTRQIGDRAVVLGGSMAGMFAAKVLACRYAEVVVIDRDEVVGVADARRAVPQGRHAHGLLARGQLVLEELFPGFTDGLVKDGVPAGDLNNQVRWSFDGRRMRPEPTDLVLVGLARPHLEHHVRTRVAALPNVRFVQETDVIAPVTSSDRQRVTGVRVQRRGAGTSEESLTADLVVDATGRGSRIPAWLADNGYPRVAEDRVKVDLFYTSRRYRWRTDPFHGDMSINPVATPAHPRGGFLHTLGKDLFLVSLTGMLGDRPPTDPDRFLAYARSLPTPDFGAALEDAEPLDDAVSFHFPASTRRRYERLPSFPDGLLVVGDAVCSFNPVYGQGMTVAGLEALILRKHLAAGVPPRPAAYFADIAKVIDAPWDISAGGDLAFPGVEGPRPLKVRLVNAYLSRLRAAATKDSSITTAFLRVACLIDPPEALLRPSLMWRVFHVHEAPAAASQYVPAKMQAVERQGD